MLRRRRLHDPLAGPPSKPGPVCDNYPVLGRDHVEPLGRLFAKCDCGKPMCDAFRRPYRQNADERADHAMRASNAQVHRPLALSWPTIMARHIWPIPSGPPKAKACGILKSSFPMIRRATRTVTLA